MILIHTPHGEFTFDAEPADVEQKTSNLIINRDGKPIAKFREWLSWHETQTTTN